MTALPSIVPAGGFSIEAESPRDVGAREALLDRAMGPGRRRKSSEAIRRGRLPAEGLAFVAGDAAGRLVATVRLWDVAFERTMADGLQAGSRGALLLGPLAVEPSLKSAGIGSAMMRHAIAEATRLGHGAIILVGDAPYYSRFGFSGDKTAELAMPGPYEKHRLLALELAPGFLDGASGSIRAAGRTLSAMRPARAAA